MKTALVKYIGCPPAHKDYGNVSTKFLVENEQDIKKLLDNHIICNLHLDGIRKFLANGELVIVNDKGGYSDMKNVWEFAKKKQTTMLEFINEVNFEALRTQKTALIAAQSALNAIGGKEQKDVAMELEGLINFLDAFQDIAVDEYGKDASVVFNQTVED